MLKQFQPGFRLIDGTDLNSIVNTVNLLGVGFPKGKMWFVDATSGSDASAGDSWADAFKTLGHAFTKIASYDLIWFVGNTAESLTTPAGISNVAVFGAGPVARPARWSGINGNTAPNVVVNQSGWEFAGIKFQAPTDASAIQLLRTASLNASDCRITQCEFNTGAIGIESNGGVSGTVIDHNMFHDITSGSVTTSGAIISTSQAQASPLRWQILDNSFINNANHVVLPGNDCVVNGNVFQSQGSSITTTSKLDISGGNHGFNIVGNNIFMGTYSIAEGYKAGTSDIWSPNYDTSTGLNHAVPA